MSTASHTALAAVIALSIKQPVLVVPLAFVSHFLLDALPHFGYGGTGFGEAMKHKLVYVQQVLNWLGFACLVILLWPQGWLPYVAAAVAMSPDWAWPYRYWFFERRGLAPPGGNFVKFHRWIQWCERPWGLATEIVTFVVCIFLIKLLIK